MIYNTCLLIIRPFTELLVVASLMTVSADKGHTTEFIWINKPMMLSSVTCYLTPLLANLVAEIQ